MRHRQALEDLLHWFTHSGIMRPADGFWGVGERLAIRAANDAWAKLCEHFPCQTPLTAEVVVLEHRRPDCQVQVALLFDLAADALACPAQRQVADQLLAHLTQRSCLRDDRPDSPTAHLWGWANPTHRQHYWTDDNAWVATLLLMLARRGRPHLREGALATARVLAQHLERFLNHLAEHGRDAACPEAPMLGVRLNPHWLGLVTMALAHAHAEAPQPAWRALVEQYHTLVLDGPQGCDPAARARPATGLPWTLSEYAYLSLTASLAASAFASPAARHAALTVARHLVAHQSRLGHWGAEHYEAPAAPHLADLIYTQNWAALGLCHAARLFPAEPAIAAARDRAVAFLLSIQDPGPEPWCAGCWRGMYDTAQRRWGGGDRFEGGASSIYSGWTNAPIGLALLAHAGSADLFAPGTAPG
jgi:hypothetical protein